MSAHAEAGAQGHEHHGPPIANQSSRIAPTLLGMFLFLGTEAMLFGSFFTAYFFVRVVNPTATIVQTERWQHWLPAVPGRRWSTTPSVSIPTSTTTRASPR